MRNPKIEWFPSCSFSSSGPPVSTLTFVQCPHGHKPAVTCADWRQLPKEIRPLLLSAWLYFKTEETFWNMPPSLPWPEWSHSLMEGMVGSTVTRTEQSGPKSKSGKRRGTAERMRTCQSGRKANNQWGLTNPFCGWKGAIREKRKVLCP
jgi:hypothetical protein